MKNEHKDKLADEDMKTLNEAIDAAKKVQGDDKADKDALEAAAKELSEKTMPIGAKMYEQAAKEAEPAEGEEKSEAKDNKKDSKSDKDEPLEGEVVDDKEK
jgi:hypothetical protein